MGKLGILQAGQGLLLRSDPSSASLWDAALLPDPAASGDSLGANPAQRIRNALVV